MTSNQGKIAVVTGASSGIGAVYADRLAKRGYDIVLVARRADRLQKIAADIKGAYGVEVTPLVADLATDSGVSTVEQFLRTSPAVSVLVNNAGIARLAPFASGSPADAAEQIALNISALTRLSQAILPGLVARNEGLIINIASVLAAKSLAISSVYSGTKAFVLAFSQGLQEELAESNVKVQVVLPASTATEIWDNSGVPLSALSPETVMRTDDLVDAALSALDQGEKVTWPSVADTALISQLEAARSAVFAASQTSKVAPHLV
jgi:short-subunit dehydrogenase